MPTSDPFEVVNRMLGSSGSSFGRRARRRVKIGGALTALTVAAAFFALWYANAWTDMIVIGIAHRDWLHNMPTIGFAGARPLAFMETLGLGLGAVFLAGRRS